jgi:hypothetical protein
VNVLEHNVPLDESLLWRRQQGYYEAASQRAWIDGTVPWRITSTPLFADGLAELIAAYARDVAAPGQPICILDLGAGTGRLAALVCKRLESQSIAFKYVMTDFVASNLEAWRRHPELQALASAGVLDMARCDSMRVQPLKLEVSGELWQPGALPGPLFAIAGYHFDTLPHALFRHSADALEEGRVTTRAPEGAESDLDALSFEFEYGPLEPRREAFVRGYAPSAPEGPWLLPVGAFACLRTLAAVGGGRFFCLAADKGARTREQLLALPFPPLARHGSVSASVNFHALRAWAGFRPWMEAASPEAALGVYGVGQGWRALPRTRSAFGVCFGGGNPLSAELKLQAVEALGTAAEPQALLSALAPQRGSPDALLRLSDALRARVPDFNAPQLARLVDVLERTGQTHFELGEPRDVLFELATVFHRAGQLQPAARWYRRSLEVRGDHPTTRFNLALCQLDLAELAEARGELLRVLALAPEHARAAELLAGLPSA